MFLNLAYILSFFMIYFLRLDIYKYDFPLLGLWLGQPLQRSALVLAAVILLEFLVSKTGRDWLFLNYWSQYDFPLVLLKTGIGKHEVIKGTVTQNIFFLKSGPEGCKGLWNNNDYKIN